MKKYLPWIICGILAISTGVLLFLTIRVHQANSTLNNTLGNFTDATIATQVAMLEGDQEQIASYQATQVVLQNQISSLESELTTAQSNSSVMATETVNIRASYECVNKAAFHPDYTSNQTMSNALKAFVKDMTGGVIQDANWSAIWYGANSSIHNVFVLINNVRVKEPFIVFFVEVGMNLKKGVFDINGQCWLDHW
jgi:hypothetical protein